MATINFLVRGKGDLVQIYVRIRDGRNTDIKTPTDLLVNPKYWSAKKGEVKHTAEFKEKLNLSKRLEALRSLLIEGIQAEKIKSKELTFDWLKHRIDLFHNRVKDQSNEFIHLMESKRDSLVNRVDKVSPYTIKSYETTIQRLKKYEEYLSRTLHIHDIDLTFHTKFMTYASKELGLSINTIGKDLKQIKSVCYDAKDRGVQVNEQVLSKRFNSSTEKTLFTTLTELELNSIREFSGPDYLENARDWLVIGCWTGCRIKDLIQLKAHKLLKNQDGQFFIRYTQNKTNKVVDIPLHPHVAEVINRLNGFPREISDVNFNKYIKELCKRVGLTYEVYGSKMNEETKRKETGMFPKWQLIRSHTCRRSFATNHYNKLPNKTIMAVTGHSTERQFLEYIGEHDNTHIGDFMEVWDIDENKVLSTEVKIRKL